MNPRDILKENIINNIFHPNNNSITINQLIAKNEALLKAKEEAEKASHAKDIFLAMLAHELRTPLTAILCWAQTLKTKPINTDKLKIAIRSIEENALVQNQLINDLLDVSSIIFGKVLIDFQTIDIATILKHSIDSFRPAAEQKAVSIKTELGNTSLLVNADPARLRQIFGNLVANAIKFTPTNGLIKISLTNENEMITIQISDNGIGIKPEFLPYIFDRFKQADSSTATMHEGLGLGLTIVRGLLKLQGGNIKADSDGENKGTTFTITLPRIIYSNNSI